MMVAPQPHVSETGSGVLQLANRGFHFTSCPSIAIKVINFMKQPIVAQLVKDFPAFYGT
jgi:hypothetical protein